jgi:hypothetical protein
MPYGEMVVSRTKTTKSAVKRKRGERKRIGVERIHQDTPFKRSGPVLVAGSLFTLEKSQG